MQKRFWHNPNAEKAGVLPTGTRAGQFLFLSAQTPIDLETGAVVQDLKDLPKEGYDALATGFFFRDKQMGPAKAQTWTIYQNLAKILAQQGSSLEHIVRQRIFLRDVRDFGAVEEAMLSFFPKDKPATMMLGVADRGIHDGIRVEVDAIALVPQKGGLRKESIYLPELASVTAPYPQAVKVGQFLFFCGLMGIDPASGRLITNLHDLGADAAEVQTGHIYTDATSEGIKAQLWLTYKHIERVLKSQGATLKDMLSKTTFYRHGMRELADRYPLRQKLFKNLEEGPALTAPTIHNLSVMNEAEMSTQAVAIAPGEHTKKTGFIGGWNEGIFPEWIKAGPFWFVSGEVGFDVAAYKPILSFADLSPAGRLLAQSRFDDSQTAMAQAWYIYQNLERMLRDAGADLSKVAHQTVFMRNPSEWPAVERIASIVFQGSLPPTTMIPIDDVGYYKELRMEIEPVAWIP